MRSRVPGSAVLASGGPAVTALLAACWRRSTRRPASPWYGPSMSARSFVTARLMETWAHGMDVADALG